MIELPPKTIVLIRVSSIKEAGGDSEAVFTFRGSLSINFFAILSIKGGGCGW